MAQPSRNISLKEFFSLNWGYNHSFSSEDPDAFLEELFSSKGHSDPIHTRKSPIFGISYTLSQCSGPFVTP
jgi:hypothetical protein